MQHAIELKGVTKTYGASRGVNDVSLAVGPGTIFGFLGPNGAGKTTTISMLVDLIRPTSGSVSIFGLDSVKDSLEIRRRIGFLAGDFALDESLTGQQQLEYFSNLRGSVNPKRIEQLAKNFDCNLKRPIKTLSRGNRQKIGLISALMHDPELLIFDEPTSGLDPLMQAAFNQVVLDHQKQGGTTFISSHLLSEVQEICGHVAFIREGSLIAVKDMHELEAGSPKRVKLSTTDKQLAKHLKTLKGIASMHQTGQTIEATFAGDPNTLMQLLSTHKLADITIQDADLETIFMEYYQPKPETIPAPNAQGDRDV